MSLIKTIQFRLYDPKKYTVRFNEVDSDGMFVKNGHSFYIKNDVFADEDGRLHVPDRVEVKISELGEF